MADLKNNNDSDNQKVDDLLLESSKQLTLDISKSLDLAIQANQIAQKNVYTLGIAESLKQMAQSCQYSTNYVEAMKYALEAKEIFKVLNNYLGEAACLNILGAVYNFLGDFNKRLLCNLDCLKLRKKAGDQRAVLSSLNNIGDTYMSMCDYDNALKYFNDCLKFENLPDDILAIVKCNIAEVNFYQEDYESSTLYNNQGLEHALKSDYYQIIIASYILNGRIYLAKDEVLTAISFFDKAKGVIKERESKEQEFQLYQLYSEAFSKLNDFKQAYHYLNKHILLREKVLSDNSAQAMKKIEFDSQLKNITAEAKEIKEKNQLITKAFKQIESQSNEIQAQNKSITDSIHYAKRIQYAILPEDEKVKKCLGDHFIFYQPKDIVSGDFYWVESVGENVVFAVVDCTGHGVPGAFMSLIANNALNKIVLENQIVRPGDIANEMNKVITELFQKSEERIRDGMDMGICTWNKKNNTLEFAGAFNSLFIYSDKQLNEIKGNRESIGASIYLHQKEFTNHQISIKKGDVIYISSDGYPDQFGGEKGKKLKWKGFREMLSLIADRPINKQGGLIADFFVNWKNDIDQLDDVCVMGVKF